MQWTVKSVKHAWNIPRFTGRVRYFNDFPDVDLSVPAFSRRAVEALRDLLEPNGELLPLDSVGAYCAYNLLTVADVLDRRNSAIKYLSDGITALWDIQHEFIVDAVESLVIFRIPEKPNVSYVTETFVARATERQLKGFDFQLVWPLPASVRWRELAVV